jgi:two-component system response regulator RegA
MTPSLGSLLLVDDDAIYRNRLAQALESRGFAVRTASGVAQALEQAKADPAEHAVVDLRLEDGSGMDVLKGLLEQAPSTRIVVLTGYGSIATALEAVRLGAAHYLTKPVDADDILAAFGKNPEARAEPTGAPSLAMVEWEHLQRVLADCKGNLSEAARRLGMHRRSLQRKVARKRPPR